MQLHFPHVRNVLQYERWAIFFGYPNQNPGVIYTGPSEEMSGVPIQLSGDTLYMLSSLIKVMLFIP